MSCNSARSRPTYLLSVTRRVNLGARYAVLAENSIRKRWVLNANVTPSRRGALVSMVESSDLGQLDHPAQLRPLDVPSLGRIAGQ
jgi:hypothetical protein